MRSKSKSDTNTQYNNLPIKANLLRASNREGIEDRFEPEAVRQSILADKYLLDHYDRAILDIESTVMRQAKADDAYALNLLRSIPGIRPVLALTILYEVGDIEHFPKVGNFISYSRLVKGAHESAGKRSKGGHNKIGNAHLKWAFSEAAVLLIRERDVNRPGNPGVDWHIKLSKPAKKISETVKQSLNLLRQ